MIVPPVVRIVDIKIGQFTHTLELKHTWEPDSSLYVKDVDGKGIFREEMQVLFDGKGSAYFLVDYHHGGECKCRPYDHPPQKRHYFHYSELNDLLVRMKQEMRVEWLAEKELLG